jgi:hypothetical protein
MSALSTYISKPVQKSLWDYLAGFPCFSLITSPFSEDVLHQMLSRHRKLFGLDSEWDFVSGDYSAATDNLKIQATKLVLEEVLRKLSLEDKILAPHLNEILLEQVLVYPLNSAQVPVLQANGQLMGSVLSFPILCILNLYTYFKTLAPSVQSDLIAGRLSFRDLPVLINGDDILFRATDEMYEEWLKSTLSVGFSLSLGKNFKHPRFLTVNSLPIEYVTGFRKFPPLRDVPVLADWMDIEEAPHGMYEPSWQGLVDSVTIHGFLNVGLLIGLSKTATGVREDSVPLNGWYAGAVMGSMYPTKMSNFFIAYHEKEIKRQTTFGTRVLNIYAHPYLGGLGFPVPKGVEPRYSEHQRTLAGYLLRAAQMEFYGHPSLHPLKPFAYLTLSESATQALGLKSMSVKTRLGSPTGPYEETEQVFSDNSTIKAHPLAMAYGDLDETFLTPTCRLSNAELNRLLKTANHQRSTVQKVGDKEMKVKMVDVSAMTSFPFKVISYDLWLTTIPPPTEKPTIIGGFPYFPKHFPSSEVPPISVVPPKDMDSSFAEGVRLSVSPVSSEVPTSLELWEIPEHPFLAAVKDFQLNSLRDQNTRDFLKRKKARAEYQLRLRMTISERRQRDLQLQQVASPKKTNNRPELKF